MTPAEKATELVDRFVVEIACSNFHIPESVSGIPCADGSDDYNDLLEK